MMLSRIFLRRLKARNGKAGFSPIPWARDDAAFGFSLNLAVSDLTVKRLRFAGMPGGLKVHLHRELPEDADIRSCVFRQDGSGWFVCLQIAVPTPEKRA